MCLINISLSGEKNTDRLVISPLENDDQTELECTPGFHPLIIELIKSDNELRHILSTDMKNCLFWTESVSKEINQLAIFEDNKLQKLILVRNVRLSYGQTSLVPIIYYIKNLSANLEPDVWVYRLEKDLFKIIYISEMKLTSSDSTCIAFNGFENTPVEISFKISSFRTQKVYQIQDRYNNILLTFTSSEVISDPIWRLKALLEILCFQDSILQPHNKVVIEFQIHNLIKSINKLPLEQLKAIRILSSDSDIINSVIYYRNTTFDEDQDLEKKAFLEKVILESQHTYFNHKHNLDSCFSLDYSTVAFHCSTKDSDNQTVYYLQYVKSLHQKQVLNEIIRILKILEEHHNTKSFASILEKTYIEFIIKKPNRKTEISKYLTKLLCKSPNTDFTKSIKQIVFIVRDKSETDYYTFYYNKSTSKWEENKNLRHIYHRIADLLEIHQLRSHLQLKALYSNFNSHIYDVHDTSEENLKRLLGIQIIYSKEHSDYMDLDTLDLKNNFHALLSSLNIALKSFPVGKKPVWNRLLFKILPRLQANLQILKNEIKCYVKLYNEQIQKSQIEQILFLVKIFNQDSNKTEAFVVKVSDFICKDPNISTERLNNVTEFPLISQLSPHDRREIQAKRKGGLWAYRIPDFIHSIADKFRANELKDFPENNPIESEFIELDLDPSSTRLDPRTGTINYNYGELVPVVREKGLNEAGIVIGLQTDDLNLGFPVRRVLIIGDLTHSSKGAISAQECARINAAIRYAAREKIPIDWFTASFGVEIQKKRGVESLDASSSTARELVKYCHHEGVQINLIIDETNIGAQSYWNALSTILNETQGILIMTPRGSMALTGHLALTSAVYRSLHSDDIPMMAKKLYPDGLRSLAGFETVHGPNADAMVYATTMEEACRTLIRHHYFSYKRPTEMLASKRFSRALPSNKETGATLLNEINNLIKGHKPNRQLILDLLKDEHSPLPIRFWNEAAGITRQSLQGGDLPQTPSTIVQEMLVGDFPCIVVFTPTGALAPADSEIIARAIYKANRRMPVLIMGSLSGFSCDPLSMQNKQLFWGASIAKAIIDHKGPIIILNIGNLIGGSFVVFSKQLNRHLKLLALEGSHVQVIGGLGASKIVFHSKICKQAEQDNRVLKQAYKLLQFSQKDENLKGNKKLNKRKIFLESNKDIESAYHMMRRQVIQEIEKAEAELFDQIHTVERAVKVGSIDAIIPIAQWKEAIIKHLSESVEMFLQDNEE